MRVRQFLRDDILRIICSVLCAVSGVIFVDTWATLVVDADIFRDTRVILSLEEVLADPESGGQREIAFKVLALFCGMLIAPWCVWILAAWHYWRQEGLRVFERCAEAVIIVTFMVITLNDFSAGAAAIAEWHIPKEYAEEAIVRALYGNGRLIWVFAGVGISARTIWPITRSINKANHNINQHG